MRDERQVQGKLLDCFSGSCCDTDSDSYVVFPDRNSGTCDSAIPFDAGDSVCARTDRRHCRYQCICCTADRYLSGALIMLIGGHTVPVEILKNMGSGVSGMFETCMVAILVAAMCALIREYGGFDALLSWIHRIFRGKKGGQLGMGFLVGTMDIATANNTVAIVMANPIAKEMAEEYGITPRKTASLLDTFSCVFQGIIPYGAQMLVAISAVSELGYNVTAFQILPKLFYPMLLLVSSLIWIYIIPERK